MKTLGSLLIFTALLALVIVPAQAQITLISGYDARCISIDGNITTVLDVPGCIDWLAKQTDGSLLGIRDGFGNSDPSIFSPGSVYSAGSVLPKEDITNVYVSNNTTNLYIAEERRANNGSSSYHLLFTALCPTAPGQTGIVGGQNVVYHLSNKDLEIQICFPKGSDPGGAEIHVRQVSGLTGVLDVAAANIWSSGAFKELDRPKVLMVNTDPKTPALDGARDSKGVITGTYDVACFAEAAVSLSDLDINPCGAEAYATVITRSSCSLTSDIKDFAGPVLYSFGGPTVSPIDGGVDCANNADLSATIDNGTPPYHIVWYDNDTAISQEDAPGPAPVGSSLNAPLAPGTHNIRCEVTDANGCMDPSDPVTFTVNPLLGVSLAGTATCPGVVTWTATPSGGAGGYTYAWKVDGTAVSGTSATLSYGPKIDCTQHTVCVELTDSKGCKTSACKKITQSATSVIQ
jgi:hypothetical protein